MCGLSGLWIPEPSPKELLENSSLAMANAIEHRGPDNAGVWSDPFMGVSLAHRRLSILDLSSSGNQPMASASGHYLIAFNGEVYNHLAIRRELEKNGLIKSPWYGHSDTETLLAAIDAWGLEKALNHCVGMFAFALWNRQEKELHLVRDRFGEKPLYWGWLKQFGKQVLVFGSELAALRALPDVSSPPINPAALSNYMRFGCIPAPLCIYAGLHQLRPGCLVSFSSPIQAPRFKEWWGLKSITSQAKSSLNLSFLESEASQKELLRSLEDAIKLSISEQAIADVPLGSFLSGGVDSSLVTAILQAQSTTPVRSFTISFPDFGGSEAGFNEAPYAHAVAKHLNTQHTEVPLTASDAQSLIPKLPNIYSEPFADSSQLPTHLVCREARRSGLTVALSGDGGDELFGGYNRHRLIPSLYKAFRLIPKPIRSTISKNLRSIPVSSKGLSRDKLRKLCEAIPESDSIQNLYALLTSSWSNTASLLQPQWQTFDSSLPIDFAMLSLVNNPAEQVMFADVFHYLPSDILVKVDRAAMNAGLETRSPFLDHRIASLAWQLPMSMKIRGSIGKWALRQILYQYVPEQMINRPKAGFAIPIGAWLRGPLRNWAEELLSPTLIRQQGFLQSEPIQRIWQQHLAGADHSSRLWTVLMWQAWYAEWR